MHRLFGTDGVRGVANIELTAELAYKLGRAGAYVLTSETRHIPRILVGMDTRISCSMLESALIAGICSVGAEAISLGVIPTPGVAYLTRYYKADAGAVISASHNTFEFNGIKFFDSNGYKLPDVIEDKIEAIINDNCHGLPMPSGKDIGYKSTIHTAVKDYVAFLKNTIDIQFKGMRIAVDCANGAACMTAPLALRELGAEVLVINDQPDGTNINDNCGSTHIEGLRKFVTQCKADIGLAFDGDADRLLAVDEKGEVVDGDKIMAIIAKDMKRRGTLKNNTIVATVMSNLGLDIMAGNEGIDIVKADVGDRYVLEEMLSGGYTFGGEQSGHVIFLQHNTTGDGLLTALQLLRVLKTSGKTMSQLALAMEVMPQILINAHVSNGNKNKYMDDPAIASMCKSLEAEFHGEGRVLIRPSGTEPLVRVMIEGKDVEYITKKAEELAKLIEKRLGQGN